MSLSKPKQCAIALAVGAVVATYAASAGFLLSISSKGDWRLPALDKGAALEWATLPRTALRTLDEPWVARRPDVVTNATIAKQVGGLLAFVLPVYVLLRRKEEPGVYGNARWPTETEIEDAELFAKTGFILGRVFGRFLRLAGELGVLVLAPPGSGKGAGVLEPNLLECGQMSNIVNDMKDDLRKKCAGWIRWKFGHRVFRLAMLERHTHRWNLYGYVPEYEADPAGCFDAVQNIATQLFPHVEGEHGFWADNARNYHIAVTMSLFETPGTLRTMGEVLRHGMAQSAEGFKAHWEAVIAARDATPKPFSQRLKQILFELITQDARTMSGIRGQWSGKLSIWQNPVVDAATSPGRLGAIGDFDLRLMRQKLTTIFVTIPPKDIARMRPLLNLFWEQALGLQCDDLPEDHPRKLKYHLGLLMDEGPACGYLPSLATYAGLLRQFWVRLMFVGQDDAQIEVIYGKKVAEVLASVLAVHIVMPPQKMAHAKAISEELGSYEAYVETRSTTNGRTTVTRTPKARPLLLPEEVMRLGPSKQLVFYHQPGSPGPYDRESIRPILAERIYSFASSLKRRMFYPPPPVPEIDVVIDHPPIVTPAAPWRAPVAADAKTLDKMPLTRFREAKQIPLPLEPPKTQEAMNKWLDDYQAAQAA